MAEASLEGIINFSGPNPLVADQRTRAKHQFYSIINHFSAEGSDVAYSHPLLVRYTYEYSCSELSQDTFLRAFFECMSLDIAAEQNPDLDGKENQLRDSLSSFAAFLLDTFFIPPSALHSLSAIERSQRETHKQLPTPDRVSVLRGLCLPRDHHRCVITRQFNQNEAISRFQQQGGNALDDEGGQLREQPFNILEVVHIMPHALTQADAGGELSGSKKAALLVLDMFDCGVSRFIEGINIDRPFNAMSLAPDFHDMFGNFSVFFDPVPGRDHTYRIDSFLPALAVTELPVTRELFLTTDGSIEPPSARLLAIHRAIAHILHLSGAGEYIDKILQDMDEIGAREGGSTELGRLVTLRLGGWLAGAVSV